MSEQKKEKIVKFALDEFKRALEDIKNGKMPNIKDLKRTVQTLNEAHTKLNDGTIKEEDLNKVIDDVADNIIGKK